MPFSHKFRLQVIAMYDALNIKYTMSVRKAFDFKLCGENELHLTNDEYIHFKGFFFKRNNYLPAVLKCFEAPLQLSLWNYTQLRRRISILYFRHPQMFLFLKVILICHKSRLPVSGLYDAR